MQKTVYSFDVFETSLVRVWAKPSDLFWELGEQLRQQKLIEISADTWQQMRIKAESAAREISKTGEVTVEQIYQQLARFLGWSTTQAQQAMHKEIALELASLRPVPAIKKRIQALQQANERVIYISDMYLSEETIRTYLKQNNVWTPGSRLYVSSEVGVSKSNGKLFPHCLAQESVKSSQLTHIGDNFHSDVKMAKKQGVKVEPISQTHLNRYEGKIADNNQLPLKFRSLLAGASRLTRLQSQETSADKQVIWDTTASAIAPILFGFVYWCLVEAQRREIQRLYFVARDGQILQKIAQMICKNWGFKIDCRYLYGSRQAWHLPAIQQIGESELDWLLADAKAMTQFLSIRSLCNRVNISPEQIKDVLSRYGFPAAKWDRNLQQHERDLVRQVFTEKEVTELIVSTAATYREKAIGYFRQEGIGDGVPFGFVDVGWSGRIQRSFSKLLSIAGLYPESGMYGFYFALHHRVKPFQNDRFLAYFDDAHGPIDRYPLSKYRCLYELFTAADHGSTTNYEQCGEQYIPVLRSPKNEEAINWGLHVLQGAAVEFGEQITNNLSEKECTTDLFLKASEMLAKEFVQSPSQQEAEVFGSFAMSPDQTENSFYELAPVYSFADWWRLLLYRKHQHIDVWFTASVARDNVIVRNLLGPKTFSMIRKIRKKLGKRKFTILPKQMSQPT
ncbi:HAD hydrolase-like protein [Brasilonema sp. CT11]|nr:HAD hydrolase-like protein [Brasilonema sp. CT11]